ncbi:MAG: DUF434 domain-containing protein [Myxococcota bacterium]
MPRGPQPADPGLFGAKQTPKLRQALAELAWLLSRGYVLNSSLKLVGDRHSLVARQREALSRAACTDAERSERANKRRGVETLSGAAIGIDAFNLVITVESAMAGGVLVRGRDGALRDLASVHGSYRRAEHTHAAIDAVATRLDAHGVAEAHWLLDRPVSNSGRLAGWIRDVGERADRRWTVELVDNPDRVLIDGTVPVVSSDAWVISSAGAWIDLVSDVIEHCVDDPWIVDLSRPPTPSARE